MSNTLVFEHALLADGWADNVIIEINSAGDIANVTRDASLSAGDTIRGHLLAGVPNLHSHAHQRAIAGLSEQASGSADNFWSWRKAMHQHLSHMNPDQFQAIAAQTYLEMLKSGYTCVAEFHYLHHDCNGEAYSNIAEMSLRTLDAASETGIAITCLPVLYQYGGFDQKPHGPGQRRFINDIDSFMSILQSLEQHIESSGQKLGAAPHSLRAVSKESLLELLQHCSPTTPIHLHIAEQMTEVEDCVNWSGLRPIEWLFQHFQVDRNWCLIHATHTTENERRLIAESDAVVGLCPTTEANLGDGSFDAKDYIKHGGQFGIGSDSHISNSPVEELRWLEYGQRLQHRCRNILNTEATPSTGRFLFEQAVMGGAQACGRKTGCLAPGFQADLIVLDTEHPLLYGHEENTILDSWIFSGNSNVVRDVYVGGKSIIKNGIHQNEERIKLNFKRAITELKNNR